MLAPGDTSVEPPPTETTVKPRSVGASNVGARPVDPGGMGPGGGVLAGVGQRRVLTLKVGLVDQVPSASCWLIRTKCCVSAGSANSCIVVVLDSGPLLSNVPSTQPLSCVEKSKNCLI